MQSIIALGFFDGVHLGHGALLRRTAELAAEHGWKPVVMTFDRSPGKDGRLLTSVADRIRLIRELYGIENVEVLPFTVKLMHMAWDAFLEMLVRDYGAAHLVCGWDYRFGFLGQGDAELLRRWCADHALGCDVVERCTVDGITVSSSFLKTLIEAGDTEAAIRWYGHPHTISGTVQPGRRLGRTLGFPTANLVPAPELLLPRDGVYAVTAAAGGQVFAGVCNIGTRPTVGGHLRTVETWLSDFNRDLYGMTLRVDFYRYLRPERSFPDLEALREQVERDKTEALAYFAESKKTREVRI